jgi:hypothetical protein
VTRPIQPVHAGIQWTGKDGTLAFISLYGRKIHRTFIFGDHHGRASRWVKDWEIHIDTKAPRAFASVDHAAADVLDALVRNLQEQGVTGLAITKALAATRKEVGLG